MSDQVLVVGAGPTGLTLAIELLRFGVPVRLIEKSDHAALYSQALIVQARTLEQFDRYGIAEEAVTRGRPIRVGKFWSDKKLITEIQLSRIPSPFAFGLVLPQNDTEALMIEYLESLGGKVERQVALEDIGFSENATNVTLRHKEGTVENATYRWVVGCDGAHSTVRGIMGVPFEGHTVPMRFALGDLHLSGEEVPGEELALYWKHGGDVLFCAKLKDDLYRIILISRAEGHPDDHKAPTVEDFNKIFASFDVKMTALSAVWTAPFHVNERKAAHYRLQNVFIAGDASHIHSPAGGQGMNTGIQDAANLAWKLAAVHNGASDALLDSYNEERGKVGEAVLRASGFGLRMATAENTVAEHLRNFVLHYVTRLGFVQDAGTKVISELAINYRDSPIVVDEAHGGPLRAGDRLPDADHEGSDSLHSHLRESKHLLIALDIPASGIPRDLKHTTILELQSSTKGWAPPLAETLGHGPLLYVVRPDGYIGFRGTGDSEALRNYARSVKL